MSCFPPSPGAPPPPASPSTMIVMGDATAAWDMLVRAAGSETRASAVLSAGLAGGSGSFLAPVPSASESEHAIFTALCVVYLVSRGIR